LNFLNKKLVLIKINVCIFAAAYERKFFKKVKEKLKKYVKYFCSLVKVYYFCNPFLNKEKDKFFENIEISLKSSKYPSI